MKHRFAFPIPVVATVLWFSCAHAAQALQSESLLGSGDPIASEGIAVGAEAADSNAYAQGTRAINDGRWSDAVTIFSQVANQASEHADGALYWKAYAQNKLGQSSAALDTCNALRHDHPDSNWIEECGALEIEIYARNGQPVQPKDLQGDDLKLLALATLMQHDEKRALTEIDQILNSNDSSERLKRGALYIMGAHHTDTVYPQIARISFMQGDVRIARSREDKHDKNLKWEKAEADLALETGYSLVTGSDGRAEIEFEDASTMYLAENSVLLFNELTTTGGVPDTEVALLSGTATLHIRPAVPGAMFLLRTPTDNLVTTYPETTSLRISSYTDGIALTALGKFSLSLDGTEHQPFVAGETLYFKDSHRIMMAGPVHPQDFSAWDEWVQTRYSDREKELAEGLKNSGLTSPIPGLAEMQGQGYFFTCEPYGTCWEPTPLSAPREVAENALPQSGGEQTQSATPGATGATPARQIGFVGKPMPNISGPSSYSDMSTFLPCLPGDVRAAYVHQGVVPAPAQFQIQPWAWAVCHSGAWVYHSHRYVWVVGRQHHHPPCHWVKSGNTIVLIPTHPRDVKNHPPVNRINPVLSVNPKGPRPIERVELDKHAPISLMKEPPKEFRAAFARPLPPAAEPHMMAYRMQDPIVTKNEPVRGTLITFNPHMQSFTMTEQQMHGGRSVPVSVPISNRTGNLQSRGGGGFGGGGGSAFHGGGGGGNVAHGGGSVGSGGGGSRGGSSGSASGGASSGGGASAPSGGAASGGGSHH